MEKTIKKKILLRGEYINKTIRDTDRLIKQLTFLGQINKSVLQKGGSIQQEKDIGLLFIKATYETLLDNIKNIIKYFHENDKDYSNQVKDNVNSIIDNFKSIYPFPVHPDGISFQEINQLSNIISSLKKELENDKFNNFIKELEKNSTNHDEPTQESSIPLDKKVSIPQQVDKEQSIPQQVVEKEIEKPTSSEGQTIKTGILGNLTDFQQIQIYGKLLDAGIQLELNRNKKLEDQLQSNLNNLSKTSKKYK